MFTTDYFEVHSRFQFAKINIKIGDLFFFSCIQLTIAIRNESQNGILYNKYETDALGEDNCNNQYDKLVMALKVSQIMIHYLYNEPRHNCQYMFRSGTRVEHPRTHTLYFTRKTPQKKPNLKQQISIPSPTFPPQPNLTQK